MPASWTDEELAAAVDAYRRMQDLSEQGLPPNKSAAYEDLGRRFGRSAKAFEFRMQNISAVLDSMGEPWLSGLKPAKNVGTDVAKRLEKLLSAQHLTEGPRRQPSYKAKLPAMRGWLIGIARNRSVVRYGDLMRLFELDRFSLRHALASLGHEAQDAGEPVLTALVVNKARGRCSSGLTSEFGIEDDARERARLYEYWDVRSEADDIDESSSGLDLATRATRFGRVAVRPDQIAFRQAVYKACLGRCVITGCDIAATLDACHRQGRDWRLGHNTARDGFLLRKDLHALYDKGLLKIDSDGVIRIDRSAQQHYADIDGQRIRWEGPFA